MLDPEALARQWVPGSGKPVVRLLARGLAATTWRVRRDRRSFAMRVPLAVQPLPAGAVAWEHAVFAAAAAAGIGPAVAARDPASGILVTDWVGGRPWTRAAARDPDNAARIAALIRRIHALAPGAQRRALGPADWIRHYTRLGTRRPAAAAPAAPRATAAALARLAAQRLTALARLPPVDLVLCHSDLHRQNLVEAAAGPVVLDWEYAHYSEPYWDLAGWISVNDLAAEDYGRRLLAGYCRGEPAAEDLRRLTLLAWLYDYVCLLWSEAWRDGFAPESAAAVARRAALLEARLLAG
jgi:thiamine kinase-like enzyme